MENLQRLALHAWNRWRGGRARDIDKHKMRGEREKGPICLSIYLKTKEMQQLLKFIFVL